MTVNTSWYKREKLVLFVPAMWFFAESFTFGFN
jgi:hypothetical protein